MAIDASINSPEKATDISLPSRLEAILYLKGKPLSVKEMTELVQESKASVEEALVVLMAGYAQRDSALDIQEHNGLYSLQLRKGLGELVKSLLPVDLSLGTLRTLATIALKKRILQSELVDLRGSGAYDHIKELVSQNFIERKRQSDGRSYWITLSDKFHRTFSVLPDISSAQTPKAA
ncbi:SMC-Scp complex subunit ScpB [Prochlorococcus sp. MIT 1307]|uniref:SMC-Scp complex subunit ScpB n=1 Tax=Prochlorococcus sp. MIT 1307 TaxID=3096219 RepID=UPI002A74AC25|nr:SMC-Scp complex subunit ScpB [Prochlorococcus sp. MIT 1307]